MEITFPYYYGNIAVKKLGRNSEEERFLTKKADLEYSHFWHALAEAQDIRGEHMTLDRKIACKSCKIKKNYQRGQGLIEYIALTALVSIVSIGAIKTLGAKVKSQLTHITNTFERTLHSGMQSGRGTHSRASHSDEHEPIDSDEPERNHRRTRQFGTQARRWLRI